MNAICLILRMRMDVLWYLYKTNEDDSMKAVYWKDYCETSNKYFAELNSIADDLLKRINEN